MSLLAHPDSHTLTKTIAHWLTDILACLIWMTIILKPQDCITLYYLIEMCKSPQTLLYFVVTPRLMEPFVVGITLA